MVPKPRDRPCGPFPCARPLLPLGESPRRPKTGPRGWPAQMPLPCLAKLLPLPDLQPPLLCVPKASSLCLGKLSDTWLEIALSSGRVSLPWSRACEHHVRLSREDTITVTEEACVVCRTTGRERPLSLAFVTDLPASPLAAALLLGTGLPSPAQSPSPQPAVSLSLTP